MSGDLIGTLGVIFSVLSVGVALAVLVFKLQSRTDKRLDTLSAEVQRLRERVSDDVRGLSERVAHIEGLLQQPRPPPAPAPSSGD